MKNGESAKDGVLAQSVEQRTENPCVPGSIPGDTTLKQKNPFRLVSEGIFCFILTFTKGVNQSSQLRI